MEIQTMCWAVPGFHGHPVSAALWLKAWTGVNDMVAGWCGRQRNWGTLESTYKDREDCTLVRGAQERSVWTMSQQKPGITEGTEYIFVTACCVYVVGGTRLRTLYELSPIFSIFSFTYLCFWDRVLLGRPGWPSASFVTGWHLCAPACLCFSFVCFFCLFLHR